MAAAGTAYARGGGGCLEEGTPILTPAGAVPIERLAPGDLVWTVVNGRLNTGTVRACTRVQVDEYLELSVGGVSLRATGEHPIQVAPGVFRMAREFRAGDTLFLWQDAELKAAKLRSVKRVRPDGAPALPSAYNLLVSPGGTYLASGLLVHNKGCFLPDTPILRSDGTQVPIRDVRPGDELLAFTPDGRITKAVVHDVLSHDVHEHVIVTTQRVVLRVTTEHPFYVGDGTFKTLEALKVGDRIFAFDGEALREQRITGLERARGRARVYNLQTDSPHTFFAAGIAVHNKGGGGCFPAGTPIRTVGGLVPVEKIVPGDTVLAVTPDGRVVTTAVEATYAARRPLLAVQTDRGRLLTTVEHPLRLDDGGFRPAGELRAGQRVLVWRDGAFQPARIESVRLEGREETVHNLHVGWPHTFIAGDFVVHNKGGGGGSRSSSSRSGGSPGGSLDQWAIIIMFGVVGVIIVLAIIKGRRSRKDQNLDFVHSPAAVARKADKTRKLLEFIARTDQTVAPDALCQAAQSTFLKLQECWQARDYGPMKPLMMPDLYAQHCGQIAGMVRNHETNMIADLKVQRVDIVNVRYADKADQREFTALITASAKDYYIDDRTQKFLRGDEQPAEFQEFWTFHRQGDSWLLREIEQTRESDALKDENFFEQFTQHQLQQLYGEVAGKEGQVGPWLEKSVETKATKIEKMLNFLVQTDKLWDRPQMIERARQVFTNVHLAEEAAEEPAVRTDELFPQIADLLKAQVRQRKAEGITVEYRNLCIRKVELILVRNFADNSQDEYTTRISAHAQRILRKNGQVTSQDEYVTPFEEYWTFGRLDRQWKLKEVLPPSRGQLEAEQENLDQDSSPAQLQWYYRQERAV